MPNIRNGSICVKCKHKEAFPNGFPCWRCIGVDLDNDLFVSEEFFVRLKTTNADRIRAMTDEELAEWLAKNDPECDPPEWWLGWLKQEAEEGE